MQEVAKTKANLKKCKCMSCPSYTYECKIKNTPQNIAKLMTDFEKVTHYEKMFCAFEKSHCIDADQGCLCADCDVYKNYRLNAQEFCIHTGGKKQHGKFAGL